MLTKSFGIRVLSLVYNHNNYQRTPIKFGGASSYLFKILDQKQELASITTNKMNTFCNAYVYSYLPTYTRAKLRWKKMIPIKVSWLREEPFVHK